MNQHTLPAIVMSYDAVSPAFQGPPAYCAPASAVLGRATVGERAILGERAVIRADGNYVVAGRDFCLGPRSTVHIAHGTYPTLIGDRVSVGENSLLHACQVGSDVVIGDNVVLLDGCVVEERVVIESGSIVFPRARVASGLWSGMPAKRIADVSMDDLAAKAGALQGRARSTRLAAGQGAAIEGCLFVAPNALIRGAVRAAGQGSIWFGCDFDARGESILLGEGCNVQDNGHVVCTSGPVTIGERTVVGHNVTLESCTVGARSLLGNGCTIRDGTVIEGGVLVAAGACTEPGQCLTGGWVWAGRPARQRFPVTPERAAEFEEIVLGYIAYARSYAAGGGK